MNRLPKTATVAASLPGNLLVAAPQFSGHPLMRGVVLILEHSPQGAKGVVLNSVENEAMQRWCRSLAAQPDKHAVLQQIQAVAASQQEMHGTSLTICMEKPSGSMEEVVDKLGSSVRLLIGHVEWPAGRLEQELAHGLWMCLPGYSQILFGEHENLWQTCLKCVGENVLLSAPGLQSLSEAAWN